MTTRGERLRAYILAKTGGRPGWQKKLVADSGVKRQTITKWTNPAFDRYPDLASLADVAAALGVSTAEIVAAMDGQETVTLDAALEARIVELVDRVVAERLGPRRQPPTRDGAT